MDRIKQKQSFFCFVLFVESQQDDHLKLLSLKPERRET